MFPADFAYARARSLDEALDLLDAAAQAGQEAKLIAGGQSLLPMMKLRLAAPQVLIDIAELKELKTGGWYGPSHTLGSLTTYRQLGGQRPAYRNGPPAPANGAAGLIGAVPALGDALAVLADPQVRALGTVGGAVAHGDPAADLPAVLLALDAEVVIAARPGRHEHKPAPRRFPGRGNGQRHQESGRESNVDSQTMLLDDFLQGIYATDLAEDEIITHIRIDTRDAAASAYEKFPHPASHLPLAGVCAVALLSDGIIERARVAVTGISPRPYRARETERLLRGASPAPDAIAAAAAQVTATPGTGTGQVSLLGDQHASAPYRAHLAEVLTRRALRRALERAAAA
jgi:aerobic carbon-monoxide dehydrogenase medium subunit